MSHFKMNKSEINPKSTIENPIEHRKSNILSYIDNRQSTIKKPLVDYPPGVFIKYQ